MAAKKSHSVRVPASSNELIASQKMLQLVRKELKAEMKAGFSKVDVRFSEVNSKLEQMAAELTRGSLVMEEQNSRNRIVLEGLSGLFHRRDWVERRTDEIETWVRLMAQKTSRSEK